MDNLFQAAKKKPAAKKAEREEVVINEKIFHQDLTRLVKVNTEISKLSAESKILSSEIKDRARTEFAKLFKSTGKFTGSFDIIGTVTGKKNASLMFLPTDRYIKIDEDRAEELREEFGDEIVTEETVFTMDSKLIEKYGSVISDLIKNCKKIEVNDKPKLISATVTYTVTKGTLQVADKYVTKKMPLDEVLDNISPVYQMKNLKIDE